MQNPHIQKLWLFLQPASVGFFLCLPFDPDYGRIKSLKSVNDLLLHYVFLYPSNFLYIRHNSREASSHSAGQAIQCILWEQKVHYLVHRSPKWAKWIQYTTSQYFFNLQFNILIPSSQGSQVLSSVRYSDYNFLVWFKFPRVVTMNVSMHECMWVEACHFQWLCGNLSQFITDSSRNVLKAGDIYMLQLAVWLSVHPHKPYPNSAHNCSSTTNWSASRPVVAV
jgi:hypothetical protein